jgi:hypothetical protein
MAKTNIKQREAAHGKKMIETKVCFWTDDIAPKSGKIIPKNAWASGVVRMDKNDAHGIEPMSPLPFNSLLEIGSAVEKVLIRHGVTLHKSDKMNKYIK